MPPSANATVGRDETPTPTAKREQEAASQKSMLGHERIMRGIPTRSLLSKKCGISEVRIQQFETLTGTPTKTEEAAIRGVLGSADYLFEEANDANHFKSRVRY